MGNMSISDRLILVGFIVFLAVLVACQNENTVPIEKAQIRDIDVFSMDAKERQRCINSLYQESLEMRTDGYIIDSSGGHRVKALLLQLEFSILVYAEGKDE